MVNHTSLTEKQEDFDNQSESHREQFARRDGPEPEEAETLLLTGPSNERRSLEMKQLFDDIVCSSLNRIARSDAVLTMSTEDGSTSPDSDKNLEPSTGLQASNLPPKEFIAQLEQEVGAALPAILSLPDQGLGKEGLAQSISRMFKHSVNTSSPGFMDKLYASTTPVGLLADLVLAALNTNVHVFAVSPMLTLIEKRTSTALARLCGLAGEHAGGISQPGGSASNASSIVIARNTLYPETKTDGVGGKRFCLFTSADGHYSVEKAAQMYGFGSEAVITVEVDSEGQMRAAKLEEAIVLAKLEGKTPFYVNATAGTTVLGSFDPLGAIADVCQQHELWLHVDGSWGGSFVFSQKLGFDEGRLKGIERADSITVSPHKMLGVPLTCSFLLGRDMRQFWKAMTLRAGYLFHVDAVSEPGWDEMFDLADLTPQCGRRGDSLKMYLSWVYYGADYFRDMVEFAHDTASYCLDALEKHPNFVVVSRRPLPCLQICFHWAKDQRLSHKPEHNSTMTVEIQRRLVERDWLIDYAPGARGKFLRIVVNGRTTSRRAVDGLIRAIDEEGSKVDIDSPAV